MVRVGLFGAFEGVDALVAAVLRAELAARMPGVELHVYTPSGGPTAIGQSERVGWSDQRLGAPTALRREELAATLDAVVIAGTVVLSSPHSSPEPLLVDGLGPFDRGAGGVVRGRALRRPGHRARRALRVARASR
jgi:hypothetical protein